MVDGAPKLNSADALLDEGSEAPSAGFATPTPNPNPTGLPILPPAFPKGNPLSFGGEPPPNVPNVLAGLLVVLVGPNALVVGVKAELPKRPVFPLVDSSFPVSFFVETLLNRSEDPGLKKEGLLVSVLVPNNGVVVPNAEVGFEDDSEENMDDAGLEDPKKFGMPELEPKAGDENVVESSLPLMVAGAGAAAKENDEVNFDEPGSSDLVPNENVDFVDSDVPKVAVGVEESSIGLAPGLKNGAEAVLDDVENGRALWGPELLSVSVLLFVGGVGNEDEPNPVNPEKPFGAGNADAEGAGF